MNCLLLNQKAVEEGLTKSAFERRCLWAFLRQAEDQTPKGQEEMNDDEPLD